MKRSYFRHILLHTRCFQMFDGVHSVSRRMSRSPISCQAPCDSMLARRSICSDRAECFSFPVMLTLGSSRGRRAGDESRRVYAVSTGIRSTNHSPATSTRRYGQTFKNMQRPAPAELPSPSPEVDYKRLETVN